MIATSRATFAVLALPLLLGACSTSQDAAADDRATVIALPDPIELVVHASDFVFDLPDTVQGGAVRVRLINDGPDFHHAYLVRLEGGHSLDDLIQALAANPHASPSWLVEVGGPNTPGAPGEESVTVVDLQPGSYAILCVIPAADGVPHLMKGMAKPFTVVAPEGAPAALPVADLTMRLDDYAFGMSGPVSAGHRSIRVENAAAQPHEVLFVKLAPGKTALDFLSFLARPEGAMPGHPMGGTTPLAQGQVNIVEIDFTPGRWALLCFVPDAGDGKPHFVHGMVSEIQVE